MSSWSLGRRYERLLYFAGPLTLACVLVLFVSVAASTRTELSQARCFDAIADALIAVPQDTKQIWGRIAADEEKKKSGSEPLPQMLGGGSGTSRRDAIRRAQDAGKAAASVSAEIRADIAIKAAEDAAIAAVAAADAAANAAAAARKPITRSDEPATLRSAIDIKSELGRVMVRATLPPGCFEQSLRIIYDNPLATPDEMIRSLRTRASDLKAPRPIKNFGVELPDYATLSVLGTPLRMELIVFTQWLQLALAPVLVLWLGSLYHTRRRECYFIKRMRDVRQLFPHLLNVYPQGDVPPLRKRNPAAYWIRKSVPFVLFPLVRLLILAFFVGGPTVAYLTSLILMAPADRPDLALVIVVMLIALLFAIAITEFMPGHIGKVFPLL